VFVDVIAVLEMPVAVVHVVFVVAMLDYLATVSGAVGHVVACVDLRLGVALVAVQMVEVVLVLDRVAPIARQVFVVRCLDVRRTHVAPSAVIPIPPPCA
jgi:hypothetical protein